MVISESSFCYLSGKSLKGRKEVVTVRGKSIPTKVQVLTFDEVQEYLEQGDTLAP